MRIDNNQSWMPNCFPMGFVTKKKKIITPNSIHLCPSTEVGLKNPAYDSSPHEQIDSGDPFGSNLSALIPEWIETCMSQRGRQGRIGGPNLEGAEMVPGCAVHGLRRGSSCSCDGGGGGRGAEAGGEGRCARAAAWDGEKKAREFRLSRWAAGSVGLSES
jgi:hypothetical protein